MANIHTDLLASAGMTEARTAAIGAYGWFSHARTTDQLATIQKDGLKPTWPQSHMTPQEVVAENLLLLQVAFLRDALSRRGV